VPERASDGLLGTFSKHTNFPQPKRNYRYETGLNKLEEHLRSSGALEGDEPITRRNSLDALANRRDEIVHKAASVSEYEAHKLTRDAAYFAESLC
jgi:hypothetical protein